jgi:hypothetical protein
MQPRSPLPGALIAFAGIAVAAWVTVGRVPFGIAGELTPVYLLTIGILLVLLNAFIAEAVMRAAQHGYRHRPATFGMLFTSWALGVLLGLTIPDVTPDGLQTILSGPHEPGLGIAIGIANPLGIVMIVTAIVALGLARGDAKGKAHAVEEEE